jgi:seryl-tRNA synthetase
MSLPIEEQLKNLQQQFDEFVESSKEIEAELESSLQVEINKNNDLQKKIHQLEDKLSTITTKSSLQSNENTKVTPQHLNSMSLFDLQ